ncbi:MAG: dipeptidase [Tenuifilum sp.]|uniref:dipeptidase n=1 Tax=Tenuifilum sp. TaxID=2760880 RepID=UPI0024AA2ABF|nr:C69 family dipeptidase [Tenuifilum sp.]MDI3526958.1 dipeptidase [Tenuifilum sp.]
MKRITLLLLIGLIFTYIPANSCTIIAVGKKASADGSIIISHTDTGPDSRIFVVPSQTFKPGSLAPVYWGIQDPSLPLHNDGEILGYIPQVEKTYKYFQSAYSHVNEYQLGIAESTTTQRPELICLKGEGKQIMTIEQAQIFALQRYKKARDAVKFIGDLMTKYGFLPSSGDGSETLVIADKEEVWVFEVFGVGKGWDSNSGKPGAIWAAQRLPEDQATMIPNWSIIKEINPEDTENFMVSENYMQEAIDRGWYDPKSGKPFIWQEVYAPKCAVEFATSRFWLFHHTFAPNLEQWPDRMYDSSNPYKGIQPYFQYVEPLSIYPFSIKPEKKISVQDVIVFQRSTFEGTIYDMTNDPNWMVPDGKGGYVKSPLATPFPSSDLRKLLKITYRRPVARHRGHYGMVLQIRDWLPDEVGGVYWVYLDNPYFSPYVPIYAGNLSVHESFKTYDPNHYDEKSARWAIDFVDNLANLKFQEIAKDVRAVRDPFEAKIFEQQAKIEEEALKLYKKSPKRAQEYLTNYSNGLMAEVTQMFLDLRNQIITKYTNNHE